MNITGFCGVIAGPSAIGTILPGLNATPAPTMAAFYNAGRMPIAVWLSDTDFDFSELSFANADGIALPGTTVELPIDSNGYFAYLAGPPGALNSWGTLIVCTGH
jgi:hypothetical protein